MDTDFLELPFLSNVGLMLTYRCTAACRHCLVEAGPHRKEEMRLDHALAWIEQARMYRDAHIEALALTGGEPFYNVENLAQISAHGRRLGFVVSVVTNAFWASTRDEALRALAQLPAVQALTISTDVYHQEAIPFACVRNAVEAARELKRVYNIAVCTDSEEDPRFQKVIEDLAAIGETESVRVSITLPVGRAQKEVRSSAYSTAPEPTVCACPVASSPVIFPNGDVIGCIGPLLTLPPKHPLFLGNLLREPLSEVLDRAERNPVLHAIRVWGPHKLVSLLKEHGFGAILPAQYICDASCDACYKLLSDERIVAALEEIFEDERLLQTVAYARVHYLNETTMAEQLHLNACDGP
jgi:organic radical activating enzyme